MSDDDLLAPAEWATHERTLVAWPARESLWGDLLPDAKTTYAAVVRAIARFEPVLVVAGIGAGPEAAAACGDGHAHEVEIVEEPIDDSWLRDSGPIVAYDPGDRRVGVDFAFNAWGGKYEPYAADAAIAARLCEVLGIERREIPLVLEGGSITIDGCGTLVTTEQCLLNPNRNPGRTRVEIETVLREALGADRVVWLERGLVEDRDTDGHVDNVCAFTAPGVVVAQGVDDPANPNAALLADNRARLEAAGLQVCSIDVLPYDTVGGREVVVPPLNAYVVNGGVIVPVADGVPEAVPLTVAAMAVAWPDREIVPIPASVLAFGGGGIHCITQQVPA